MKRFFVGCILFFSVWNLVAQDVDNVIRFSPLGVSDVGMTIGLDYEKFVKTNSRFSVVLPIEYVFDQHDTHYPSVPNRGYFHFRPGMKLTTGSGKKVVQYAIGVNWVLGYGTINRYQDYYDRNGKAHTETRNYRAGFMLTNYLNFRVSNKIVMGLHFGYGTLYVNKDHNKPEREHGEALQLGVSFGYNF